MRCALILGAFLAMSVTVHAQSIRLDDQDAAVVKAPYDETFKDITPCFSDETDPNRLASQLQALGWAPVAKPDTTADSVVGLGWENYMSRLPLSPNQRISLDMNALIQGVQQAYGAATAPDTPAAQTRLFNDANGRELLMVHRAQGSVLLCKVVSSGAIDNPLVSIAKAVRDQEFPVAPQAYAMNLPNQVTGAKTLFARVTLISPEAWQPSAAGLKVPTAFISAGRALSPEG